MKHKYAIWWLDQAETEIILNAPNLELPVYIAHEVVSRAGRPGRGRLWISNHLKGCPYGFDWDDKHPNAGRLSDSGGIVIRVEDVKHVKDLVGVVTVFGMDFYQE